MWNGRQLFHYWKGPEWAGPIVLHDVLIGQDVYKVNGAMGTV